ncbi:MAG TPA: GntR family transcriptional regulator [Candidatus Acidoferrum sp.]|nr:GntR family transcriptional regulator [Candidatus Acidoferrum sp.]
MIPFRVAFTPGIAIYDQVVYAAKKAIVAGQLAPGAAFPSVRALSKELKINPNTAHKVIAELTSQGLLDVLPGIGTVISKQISSTVRQRKRLLGSDLERLVVEAKKFGLELNDVISAVTEHWEALQDAELPKEVEHR